MTTTTLVPMIWGGKQDNDRLFPRTRTLSLLKRTLYKLNVGTHFVNLELHWRVNNFLEIIKNPSLHKIRMNEEKVWSDKKILWKDVII